LSNRGYGSPKENGKYPFIRPELLSQPWQCEGYKSNLERRRMRVHRKRRELKRVELY